MSAVRAPSHAYLPHGPIVDLVRAALFDGDAAATAWRRGRSEFEGSPTQRAPAANWLRPMLAANLDRLGIDDPLMPELRAQRDAARAANARLFDHVGELVERLEAAGTAVMLLKGAALVGTDGEDWSVRPMSDVDLLVPRKEAERALAITESQGWTPRHRVDANFLAVKHAAHFADADRCQLDLHWYVYEECARPGVDEPMWMRSSEAGFRGTAARRSAATDALLHACVHGARWTRTPGIRWVTDAWRIIASGDVAWETLLAEADRRAFIVRLRRPLRYLRAVVGAAVPEWVDDALVRMRPGLVERLEHAALAHEQRRLGALPSYVFAFHRAHAADGPLAMIGFPGYLAAAWGVDSVPDLVRAGARRAADRLSGSTPVAR